MTRLDWVKREGVDSVWDARVDHNTLTVIGGAAYGCAVNGRSVGQRGTKESAQEWCEHIAESLPPRAIDGELHLWTIMDHAPSSMRTGRYIIGRVYGDPRFPQGEEIHTLTIVDIQNEIEGDYVKTRNKFYLLAKPERTAELILKGFESEREKSDVPD